MDLYDLIAFDMDGTLLDSRKEILPSSIQAIEEATGKGKTVVLSTGRCLPELREALEMMPSVRYAIAISGALVLDVRNGKVLFSAALEEQLVEAIFQAVEEEDVMVHLLSMDSLVQKDREQCMAKYSMGIYQSMFDRIARKVEDIHRFWKEGRVPVYKFNLYCQTESQRRRIEERLGNLPLSFVHAEGISLECSPQGIGKGSGLQALCRYLGIPLERTIAVGDSDNDLGIFQVAGLAVGMGNANEHARSACAALVADNDHGGCAEAIHRYLLGL